MANRWNIPPWLEKEVLERDKSCVYCRTEFTSIQCARKSSGTWEHIINDIRIITPENIVRCCQSCNSSKQQKRLSVWLDSDYCKAKGITLDTVAPSVKSAIVSGF